MRNLKLTVNFLLSIILTLFITEFFLQLVLSRTIENGMWFTGNIHKADNNYGFIYSPNYYGMMRHPDNVFCVPLKLNDFGFRDTIMSSPVSKNSVVFLGGYSMMFGYGLENKYTIPAIAAKNSNKGIIAYDISMVGMDLLRIHDIYKKKYENIVTPRIVIVSFYNDDLKNYSYLPNDFSKLKKGDSDKLFFFNKGNVLAPSGVIANKIGPI